SSTTKKTSVVLTFQPRSTSNTLASLGTSINLSIRAMAHAAGPITVEEAGALYMGLEVWVYRAELTNGGSWKQVDYPSTSTTDPAKTVDLDGLLLMGGAVAAPLERFISIRTRMEFSKQDPDDETSSGILSSDGEVK